MVTVTDSTRHKINSLESLRGLAAFAVLLSHLVCAFWPTLNSGTTVPLSTLWHNGAFAVRLFFVLSGFVLSLSYFHRNESLLLSAAAARRYCRLYVPAAASVMFAYALHVGGAFDSLQSVQQFTDQSEWMRSLYSGKPSLTLALREALFGAVLDYQFMKYNEVLWTMAVELKGSLLVFATLALFGNARHRWFVYGTMIFALDSMQLPFAVDFICGTALSDWHTHNPHATRSSFLWIPAFLAGCCLGDLQTGWLQGFGIAGLTRGNRWWPTIAAVLLVASSARSSQIQILLQARPLVWLGRISFALYLFHLPIICSLGAWTYTRMATLKVGHDTAASLAGLASIAASLAIAQLGPLFLDPLAIRVGRWVEHQLFPSRETRETHVVVRVPELLIANE